MSLRSKLILSFMAFASLLLMVGLTSLYLNRAVQADVADLRAIQGVDFRHVDVSFPHTASSAALRYRVDNTEGSANESWGIDNVEVFVR